MKQKYLKYTTEQRRYVNGISVKLKRLSKGRINKKKKFKKDFWLENDLVWMPKLHRAAVSRNTYALQQDLILKIAEEITKSRAVDNQTCNIEQPSVSLTHEDG
jgi:hypothetical protein